MAKRHPAIKIHRVTSQCILRHKSTTPPCIIRIIAVYTYLRDSSVRPTMVCKKCEKKLTKVAVPDKWKDGARNTSVGSSSTSDRKLNENKLLSKSSKSRFSPYENKCKICKSRVHQEHAHYCQSCAYKQGICAMCGKQVYLEIVCSLFSLCPFWGPSFNVTLTSFIICVSSRQVLDVSNYKQSSK
ncbi:microtubule-associated protein CRIPT-domain-containing protein [Jimgerdemannia flammicorona]|uniref:Cysteine-rich PDZ-binding protein n=1 Tax=Jimgerdemannia flammicorona TaxID=994334 RepID=A0A433DD85_9FUNG|nr:microtubule-associated protein CRIPT-domain-containing protein [Jimgerdemannia flammicorona]